MKRFAIFREPNRVLVGIEPETFNVIQLAERYGSGSYLVLVFLDGKVVAEHNQVVDEKLGPPKKTEPLPEGALPSVI